MKTNENVIQRPCGDSQTFQLRMVPPVPRTVERLVVEDLQEGLLVTKPPPPPAGRPSFFCSPSNRKGFDLPKWHTDHYLLLSTHC